MSWLFDRMCGRARVTGSLSSSLPTPRPLLTTATPSARGSDEAAWEIPQMTIWVVPADACRWRPQWTQVIAC